jgi:hypothetical protein
MRPPHAFLFFGRWFCAHDLFPMGYTGRIAGAAARLTGTATDNEMVGE